jgi:hypothetical protein
MLKQIRPAPCSNALRACKRLQEMLLAWLCDPGVSRADVNQANLTPPRVPTQIEADWLWVFLQKAAGGQLLLTHAQTIAAMSITEKAALRSWAQIVNAVADQFLPNPQIWPANRPIPDASWNALKILMEAFYEKGFRSGLPYGVDGTPVVTGGVTYAQFVQAFRDTHRQNQNPDAREVCVLCGGPLGQPRVDHWIARSAFPLLSVCADNLLPVCDECNSPNNKGTKPVFANGTGVAFEDWFHPYLRHANGAFQIAYDLKPQEIKIVPLRDEHTQRVTNLDRLLNLTKRWTIQFKAEYLDRQQSLRRLIEAGRLSCTQGAIQQRIQDDQLALVPTQPHYEIHSVLLAAMLDPARTDAWQTELGL